MKARQRDLSYFLIYRQKLKNEAFQIYSRNGKVECICCGCPFSEYLEIDHIEGGGRKHRKILDTQLARWLKKNEYPKGYQILCSLCNRSKNKNFECNYHKFLPKRDWINQKF